MGSRPTSPLAHFKRLHLTARAAADRCLDAEGISVAQFGVLRLLDDDPGLTGAELARRSLVTAPSMNEMLAMLLRDGFVSRSPDPKGGRGIQLFITPAGRSVLATGTPVLTELSRHLLADIDEQRLADFFAVLDIVVDRADAYGRVDAP